MHGAHGVCWGVALEGGQSRGTLAARRAARPASCVGRWRMVLGALDGGLSWVAPHCDAGQCVQVSAEQMASMTQRIREAGGSAQEQAEAAMETERLLQEQMQVRDREAALGLVPGSDSC